MTCPARAATARSPLAWLVGAAVALAATSAAAQLPAVEVRVAGCAGVAEAAVRQLVGIELGAAVPDAAAGDPAGPGAVVVVACARPFATITIDDRLTGKKLERRIDLSRHRPAAHARLLALSITELLAASWIELGLRAPEVVAAAEPHPAPAAAREAALAVAVGRAAPDLKPRRPYRLLALGGGRSFHDGGGPVGGGGVAVEHDLGPRLVLSLDLVGETGRHAVSLGHVGTRLLSLAPALLVRTRAQGWSLAAGAGARAGLAWLRGEAAPAPPDERGLPKQASALAPWAGPLVTARAQRAIARLVLSLGLEAGVPLVRAGGLVGDRREVGVAAPWVGGHLGVGMTL